MKVNYAINWSEKTNFINDLLKSKIYYRETDIELISA